MNERKPNDRKIRLWDVFQLLPGHELVTVRVHSRDGYYTAFTGLVYEGVPYLRAFAFVESIRARANECTEVTIFENYAPVKGVEE